MFCMVQDKFCGPAGRVVWLPERRGHYMPGNVVQATSRAFFSCSNLFSGLQPNQMVGAVLRAANPECNVRVLASGVCAKPWKWMALPSGIEPLSPP